MHYIFIALASGLILKEHISRLRLVGTLVIVLGIIFVSL
jgi:drug/metabolite transporter (DMT)-like permease